MSEIHKSDINNSGTFNPDKRTGLKEINNFRKTSNEKFNPDKRVETRDFSTKSEKIYNPDERVKMNDKKNDNSSQVAMNPESSVNRPDKSGSAKSFAERLKAAEERNADTRAETVYKNKLDGCAREETVMDNLAKKYPESKGYTVVREAYLRVVL